MKRTTMAMAVTLAGLVASPALADEPSYLGAKSRYSKYVPAPAPVPETFSWYLRLDLGVGLTNGDTSANGAFGNDLAPFWAGAPGRVTWFDSPSNAFFQGGIGIGKYLSPRFRMDATLDFKTADESGGTSGFQYLQFDGPAPGGAPTGGAVLWAGSDRVEVVDGVLMLNGYVDLAPRGGLTPYIGLGAGVAARYIDRRHSSTEAELDAPGGIPTGVFRTWEGEAKDTRFAPALSATVGLAWSLSTTTMLDINYRYTYIGSVDSTMTLTPSVGTAQTSKVTISESHQHAIRAGLRWNIW